MLVCATALWGLVGGQGVASAATQAGAPIKVAEIIPVTGPVASYGAAWIHGSQLATQVLNAKGGVKFGGQVHRVVVTNYDTEGSTAGAQRVTQQALAAGFKFFLGPNLTNEFQTAYPLMEGGNRIVFSTSTAAETYLGTSKGRGLFKTIYQNTGPSGGITKFVDAIVSTYHPKTVGILLADDPTGQIYFPAFKADFAAKGVKVVYATQYPSGTTDFSSYISALRSANPDVVAGPYLDSDNGAFLQQAQQVGYTQPVFASYGGSEGSLANLGPISSIKLRYTWPTLTRAADNPKDPVLAKFRKLYIARYGHPPTSIDMFALTTFDPLLRLAAAIQKAGSQTNFGGIVSALKSSSLMVPGHVLNMTFDSQGEAHYQYQQAFFDNGKVTYQDF